MADQKLSSKGSHSKTFENCVIRFRLDLIRFTYCPTTDVFLELRFINTSLSWSFRAANSSIEPKSLVKLQNTQRFSARKFVLKKFVKISQSSRLWVRTFI